MSNTALSGGLTPLLIGTANIASAASPAAQYLNAANNGLLIKNMPILGNSTNSKKDNNTKLNQLLLGHHYQAQAQAQLNSRILNQLGLGGNQTTDLLALQRSLNAQAFLSQQQQQQQHQQQQQQHLNLSGLNGQFNQNNLAQSFLNNQNNILQAALQQQQQQQQGQAILYRNGTLLNQLQLNNLNVGSSANSTVVAAALAQQNSNQHRYLRPQLGANNLQFNMSPMPSGSPVSLASNLSPSAITSSTNANSSSNSNSNSGSSQQQRSNNTSHLSGVPAGYT